MPNQIKPTPWVYVFYNLQGQSFVSQFLILDLNFGKDFNLL